MKLKILKRRLDIGKQIDDFLDQVSESGLLFKNAINDYLKGDMGAFGEKMIHITDKEHKGDDLRRSIEEQLYIQTLIPESRGDVLDLLENMDVLLDRFKGTLYTFDIEQPKIFTEIHSDFNELINCVVESVEAMVRSCRSFFKEISALADHMHKVSYWETESDKISTRLQRTIFRRDDLQLSEKIQLRDFVRRIDKIADRAEDASDKLSIFAVKRSL